MSGCQWSDRGDHNVMDGPDLYLYHQTPASEAVEDTSVPLLLSVTLWPAHPDQASAQTRPHLSSPSVRGIEVKVLISTTAFIQGSKADILG